MERVDNQSETGIILQRTRGCGSSSFKGSYISTYPLVGLKCHGDGHHPYEDVIFDKSKQGR